MRPAHDHESLGLLTWTIHSSATPSTHQSGVSQSPRRFLGWRIAGLAIITGAMTGPGQTIGVSVSIDPLVAELGLNRVQVSTAYLIGTMVGAALLLPIGSWIDRVGARHAMRWIGAAFGIGLVAMAGVRGFVTLTMGFTLIRWLGQGALSLVSSVAIMHWFERLRGRVVGVTSSAVITLMSFTPLMMGVALAAYGLRTAWLLTAAAVWLVVIPIAHFGIVDRPSDVGQRPDGIHHPVPLDSGRFSFVDTSVTRREAVVQPRFILMSLVVGTGSMIVTGLNFHQVSILGEAGLTPTAAAAMFVPQVLGTVGAGLTAGIVADRLPARFLLAASMVLLICALLMIGILESGWPVYVYAVVLGASMGAQAPLVPTVLPRWFGLRNIGGIHGVSMLVMVAGSAIGPVTVAVLEESGRSYPVAASWLTLIPLATGLGALTIKEPKR